MIKRQKFFSESHYKNFLNDHDEAAELLKTTIFKSDTPEGEATLRSRFTQRLALRKLTATYTAGEDISSLPPLLEDLIEKYETRQTALAESEKSSDISPLALDNWPHEYEECVQVIGFCILLHRTDLLKRFVNLIDKGGV